MTRKPSARSVLPSVRRATERAIRRLGALGDADRARGQRAYFKRDETVRFFGVAAPAVRAVAREVHQTARGAWSVREATAFCDAMVRRRELEAKVLGVLVLARFAATYPKGLLRTAKRWLREERLATWAAVDALAPGVITPLIERFPELGKQVRTWTRDRNVWIRRAAAVAFVPLARRGRRLGDAYAVAIALRDDEHDLIHKATGWLLREAGKTDMTRLEHFLRRRGDQLPRTAVRYAIERFPPAKRRRLLEATR